jgi:hypothetical protein
VKDHAKREVYWKLERTALAVCEDDLMPRRGGNANAVGLA